MTFVAERPADPGLVPVFLALGANLGDRRSALRAAVAALPPGLTVERVSPVYETAPMYVTDQPAFLNCVLQGVTTLAPGELLHHVKQLEADLGRTAGRRFGPRAIDIDILFYGQARIRLAHLEIPHPRLAERAFVLIPLRDIAPDWMHPVLQQTAAALAAAVDGVATVSPAGRLEEH